MRREASESKAEGILAEELARLGWAEADLVKRHKSDPGRLEMAGRLRRERTLPLKWIVGRLHMGTWKSAGAGLRTWKRDHALRENPQQRAML